MSSGPSTKGTTPDPSQSDKLNLEIHVLECGHGDTILIRLPKEKWALIDCHLPQGRIRDRFFQFVEDRHIVRLDLLCLTKI